MLSVGAIRYEDRFSATKRGGIGGGGRVSPQGAMHMAAAWLAVEKPWSALPGPFLSFLTQMGVDKFLCLFRGSISGTVAFTGWRTLTIVSSLMSGCGRGLNPGKLDGRILS